MTSKRQTFPPHPWARYSDRRLLQMRFCDLNLRFEHVGLRRAINQLYAELHEQEILFRPHVWLSHEWFTPDKVPGIAIPFYLAHERLRKLEESQMLEVEGGTHDWCMRILRHEAGHAIDNAFRLHLRKKYKQVFGSYFKTYPESYRPRPYSHDFVVHLDMWYAQAHPAEDFAETFAVWLNPRSHWMQQYAGWGALKKLKLVNEIMRQVAQKPAPVRSRRHAETLSSMKMTLGEYYQQRKEDMSTERPGFYDRDLRRLFSDDAIHSSRPAAHQFLSDIRPEARMMVSRWTGETQLTIDRSIADMIKRCRRLKLRLKKPATQTRMDVMMMLAVQTMNYLNDGKHRVMM